MIIFLISPIFGADNFDVRHLLNHRVPENLEYFFEHQSLEAKKALIQKYSFNPKLIHFLGAFLNRKMLYENFPYFFHVIVARYKLINRLDTSDPLMSLEGLEDQKLIVFALMDILQDVRNEVYERKYALVSLKTHLGNVLDELCHEILDQTKPTDIHDLVFRTGIVLDFKNREMYPEIVIRHQQYLGNIKTFLKTMFHEHKKIDESLRKTLVDYLIKMSEFSQDLQISMMELFRKLDDHVEEKVWISKKLLIYSKDQWIRLGHYDLNQEDINTNISFINTKIYHDIFDIPTLLSLIRTLLYFDPNMADNLIFCLAIIENTPYVQDPYKIFVTEILNAFRNGSFTYDFKTSVDILWQD